VNSDVLAVYRAILDRGLGADFELALHLGVAVKQEFDGLALLSLGDLEPKRPHLTDAIYPRL